MTELHTEATVAARVADIAALLKGAGQRLAAAESCTGGWIAKCCTDLAGSSAWFERGFVTYSNEAKREMLGVREQTLAAHGAVSASVVAAMAEGALARSRADWALSVSGVAGPDGGTPDKPVGTVWFAWMARGGQAQTQCHRLSGDREAVRLGSVAVALEGLLARLRDGGS